MYFIRIKEEYIEYLKEKEERIPNQDYGENKYKPFYILSSLDSSNDVLYVTQITSPKERHYKMSNNIDFLKLNNPEGQLIGATNLNYMFPVLPEYIEHLSFNDLKKIVQEQNKIKRLKYYKKELDNMNLRNKFEKIYNLKCDSPEHPIARRCLDFKQLEAIMLEFKLQEQFYNENIKVERSDDYSTFFVTTEQECYEFPESILEDLYSFLEGMSSNIRNECEQQLENNQSLDL